MAIGAKNITVNINPATVIKVVLVLFLLVMLYQLRDIVLVVLTAVVIASAIEPATKWLSAYKVPRVISVIIIYLTFFIFITGIFYFFVPSILVELRALTQDLPAYFDSAAIPLGEGGFFQSQIIQNNFQETFSITDTLGNITDYFNDISNNFLKLVSNIFGGVLSFVLIIVISFYLAVQERGIYNFLRLVTPVKHEDYITNLWDRSQKKIGRWFQGQLILALIVGILVYLGLTILGIKNSLLLALIAAVFELIPIFGPILAAVPAILLAFIGGGVTPSIMVLALYVIIQQFENQLIYPLVVKKVIGVPPIIAIIAIIAGGKLAGFLGIILSIPLASILIEVLNDFEKEKNQLRGSKNSS